MSSVLKTFYRVSKWLDSHGVESRGIHRYLPEERANTNLTRAFLSIYGLWISGCGGLTSMSSYFLGPLLFGLGYRDSMIYGVLGTVAGCAVASYTATMGPRSGLRQMCSARYLFGPYMVRLVSIITIVGFLGWSVTNSVLGGEILSQINGGGLSLSLGVTIVCIISLLVALFGINYLLKFESFVGLLVIFVVFLLYIIAGPQITKYHDLQTLPGDSFATKAGVRISFFNLAYSVTATWGGCASDYYVVLPETVSQKHVFFSTFFGTTIPTLFGAVIGILIGNAAVGYVPWGDAYEANSLGGLLNVVFGRWHGFGKFLLVIFWLSLITNNTINNYSSALSVQLIDNFFFKYFPRWFIVVIIFVITLICSLVGRNSFSAILSNFLPMLGYWISIYATLLLEENLIFRSTRLVKLYRYELYGEDPKPNKSVDEKVVPVSEDKVADKPDSTNIVTLTAPAPPVPEYPPPFATTKSIPYYNFNVWNETQYHSHGLAAIFAFCCGVVGAVLGMNQAYFAGPIAKMVGEDAADLGTFLAVGFTGIAYPLLRYAELKTFGK
ncbi:DEKNAAC102195 [Brettanomyces naardenensis]|uniref:DEKNAAC102195 n=1 Tax=Brettanomyces naardenensis TaxID=13370 RepID=A0A448YK34_BRENA|nr:DEKNAAC102195 [Brettanomyces naardenensis]